MKNYLEKEIFEIVNLLKILNKLQNDKIISKIDNILFILKDYSKEQMISCLDELMQDKKDKLNEFDYQLFFYCIVLIKIRIFLLFDSNDYNKIIDDCLKELYKVKEK